MASTLDLKQELEQFKSLCEKMDKKARRVGAMLARDCRYTRTWTHRQRRIIELRYGLHDYHPRTLDEVGAEFAISRERVRQLQKEAFSKS